MSDRVTPVWFIEEYGFRRGAELGVWRGNLAWAILDQTDVEHLLLVDPWDARWNQFRTTEPVPPRMKPGEYHCTMGEWQIKTQADLDLMAAEVQQRAAQYNGRVDIARMTEAEAAHLVPTASLDFVLIDAIQLPGWLTAAIGRWWDRVRPGGMLGGSGGAEKTLEATLKRVPGCQFKGDFWWVMLRP